MGRHKIHSENWHTRERRAAKISAKSLPDRIEAIGKREDAKCKTPGRDPLDGLVLVGRLRGVKVG